MKSSSQLHEKGHTSDSDDDPNECAFRPRREASIRARVADAINAMGKHHTGTTSRVVKVENEDGIRTFASAHNFFQEDENASKDRSRLSSTLSQPPSSSKLALSQKRPREVFDCVLIRSRTVAPKRRKLDAIAAEESFVIDLTENELSTGTAASFGEVEEEEVEEEEVEEFKKKMKLYKNDKVKKNEDKCLLPETLRARLRPIGFDVQDQYITIDKLVREHMVTRQFMSQTYGGSTQKTCPNIGIYHAIEHDMRDFFYLNTEFQPQAPEVPGAPGLCLSTEPGNDLPGVWRVITKIKDTSAKNDNKWLYVGQYDIRAADPPYLTVQEWSAQTPAFHNKWAKAIVSSGWGASVRARLHGRKVYKRSPTVAEQKAILEAGTYKTVTEYEVRRAYLSGIEKMGVWTLKCIQYDNAFQKELSEKFTPDWVPFTAQEREAWKKRQKEKIELMEDEMVKRETE